MASNPKGATMRALGLCLIAVPFLIGCQAHSSNQTTYVAPPEVNARADGEARGYEFAAARVCGASLAELSHLADKELPPPVGTPELATVYRKAFATAYALPMTPTPEFCEATRRNSKFAGLLPAPAKSLASARPVGGPASQTAQGGTTSKPAYCPSGSMAAEQASSFVEGLDILRLRCRTGDSLLLHSQNTGLIASACDMNKPVSSVGGTVFCTMGTLREMRRP